MMFLKKNKKKEVQRTEGATEPSMPFGAEQGVRGKNGDRVESPSHPRRKRQKTKLRLMTKHEEAERAFAAAREHYLTKNLPSLRVERSKKKQDERFRFFWDRIVAAVGFFLVVFGLVWLYDNYDLLLSWWKMFIDKLDLL